MFLYVSPIAQKEPKNFPLCPEMPQWWSVQILQAVVRVVKSARSQDSIFPTGTAAEKHPSFNGGAPHTWEFTLGKDQPTLLVQKLFEIILVVPNLPKLEHI